MHDSDCLPKFSVTAKSFTNFPDIQNIIFFYEYPLQLSLLHCHSLGTTDTIL